MAELELWQALTNTVQFVSLNKMSTTVEPFVLAFQSVSALCIYLIKTPFSPIKSEFVKGWGQ